MSLKLLLVFYQQMIDRWRAQLCQLHFFGKLEFVRALLHLLVNFSQQDRYKARSVSLIVYFFCMCLFCFCFKLFLFQLLSKQMIFSQRNKEMEVLAKMHHHNYLQVSNFLMESRYLGTTQVVLLVVKASSISRHLLVQVGLYSLPASV